PPVGTVGGSLMQLAAAGVRAHIAVHLSARRGFDVDAAGTSIHVLGAEGDGSPVEQVEEFTHRACNAFLKHFRGVSAPITLLGCEWSSALALSILRGIKDLPAFLSLHSLERQRSTMNEEVSRRIEEIEVRALREARAVLVHDPATAALASELAPDSGDRLLAPREIFPVQQFETGLDPGQVKARYHIGPVDP